MGGQRDQNLSNVPRPLQDPACDDRRGTPGYLSGCSAKGSPEGTPGQAQARRISVYTRPQGSPRRWHSPGGRCQGRGSAHSLKKDQKGRCAARRRSDPGDHLRFAEAASQSLPDAEDRRPGPDGSFGLVRIYGADPAAVRPDPRTVSAGPHQPGPISLPPLPGAVHKGRPGKSFAHRIGGRAGKGCRRPGGAGTAVCAEQCPHLL